ncbi:MAG: hypothetical protein ACE5H7_07985 [Acidiferrobacterales bacterium]
MYKFRTLLFMVFSLSFWATTNAAQLVVIASNAPALKAGAIVDGAASITLSPGVTVTLISPEGKTIKLKGPYKGTPEPLPSGKTNNLLSSLSRIVTGPPENDPSLAVFRAAPGAARPGVWAINVGRSGVYCVRPDEPVTLWRAHAGKKVVLTVKQVGGQQRETRTEWSQGKRTMIWPAELPLADGVTYLARPIGGYRWANLTILLVPTELPTQAHRAAWMAENGCARQARILVGAIARRGK